METIKVPTREEVSPESQAMFDQKAMVLIMTKQSISAKVSVMKPG
ncbi:hypothetical protein J3L18_31125 [Mucilaginibacter gossypii]|nr:MULTISPECIES: hypothetical protein [Mucilaginibacter]WMH62876.1 hypothetical protein J3L18_31125 [Mucilaginibacter gossypii]